VVEFLKTFKTATQVLSGSKYPTISLVLLFAAEILAALQDLPTDCVMHGDVDETAHATGLSRRRLPVTELNIGAFLDPSQRNFE